MDTEEVIVLMALVSGNGKLRVKDVSVVKFLKPFKLFLFFNNKLELNVFVFVHVFAVDNLPYIVLL